MAKHTLKILRCEHRKIFKVCLAIFQHYEIKVKLIIENSKRNKDYFKNNNNNDSYKSEKFVIPKKLQNSEHQTIKILTTVYPSTVLKHYKRKKEMKKKINMMNMRV